MKLADSVLEELWFAEDDQSGATQGASDSLASKLGQISGLKPFPQVAQKILALLSNRNFRVVEVTSALEEDPSLAAGVMRMANSALFAGAKACSSIQQAFVRLGAMGVRDVVASVATMELFPDSGGLGNKIRDHCASTAALVQVLSRDFTPKHNEGMFLCGLMHDVGKMLLIESEEIVYASENMEQTLEPDQIHLTERKMLGYDHAVLGGHVLKSWKIPDPIPQIVAWHHQPTRGLSNENIATMVSMLRVADHLDAILRKNPENLETVLSDFSRQADCTYLEITGENLIEVWDTLYQVRGDSLSFFGV